LSKQFNFWQHSGSRIAAAFGPSTNEPIFALSIYDEKGDLFYYSFFEVPKSNDEALTMCLIADASKFDNSNITSGLRHYRNACLRIRERVIPMMSMLDGDFTQVIPELGRGFNYKLAGLIIMGIDVEPSPREVHPLHLFIPVEYQGRKLAHYAFDFLTGPHQFSGAHVAFNVVTENMVVGDKDVVLKY
jgi:hypothetical protein